MYAPDNLLARLARRVVRAGIIFITSEKTLLAGREKLINFRKLAFRAGARRARHPVT